MLRKCCSIHRFCHILTTVTTSTDLASQLLVVFEYKRWKIVVYDTYIYGLNYTAHVSHKLKELEWLNMYNRRCLHTLCFIHKVIKYRTPDYLYSKFVFRSHVNTVNTHCRFLSVTVYAIGRKYLKDALHIALRV